MTIETDVSRLLVRARTVRIGWDGFSAAPPSDYALKGAEEFLTLVLSNGLDPSRVEPSVVGGVGITFRKGERSVYAEILNGGKVVIVNSVEGVDNPDISTGSALDWDAFVRIWNYLNDKR